MIQLPSKNVEDWLYSSEIKLSNLGNFIAFIT
jgi:hypothetical protein